MAAAAAKDQAWIGRLTSSKVTEVMRRLDLAMFSDKGIRVLQLETKTPTSTKEVTVKVSYTTATGTKQKQCEPPLFCHVRETP